MTNPQIATKYWPLLFVVNFLTSIVIRLVGDAEPQSMTQINIRVRSRQFGSDKLSVLLPNIQNVLKYCLKGKVSKKVTSFLR